MSFPLTAWSSFWQKIKFRFSPKKKKTFHKGYRTSKMAFYYSTQRNSVDDI